MELEPEVIESTIADVVQRMSCLHIPGGQDNLQAQLRGVIGCLLDLAACSMNTAIALKEQHAELEARSRCECGCKLHNQAAPKSH